ncbi:hypothetical protein WJX81_003702 [Elliptochloris bilobata]|uniref:Uncharacterized protein n=1 Tax=Elliptochloris bilobata TaxID=381761 RepID=A0AAW1QJN8_9CHLO
MLKEFGRSYWCVTKSAGTWTMEDWMMFCTCHERFLLRDNLMRDQFTEAWRSLCDASCFALRAVHPDDPHLPFTLDGIHVCVARLQRYSQRVEQLLHCGPSAVALEFWVERQMHAVKARSMRYEGKSENISCFLSLVYVAALGRPAPVRRLVEVVSFVRIRWPEHVGAAVEAPRDPLRLAFCRLYQVT